MLIDVHCHYFPPVYLDRMQDAYAGDNSTAGQLARRMVTEISRRVAANPYMTNIDERLKEMDRHGVDVQVLSLGNLDVYFAGEGSLRLARMTNDALAAVCQAHPDRFKAFACVPLNRPEDAALETRRAIEELDMRGVVIATNIEGTTLDSPTLLPFYDELDRLGRPLSLHPTTPLGAECYLDYGLAPVMGFIVDTNVAVMRMILSGLFDRCQNLRLIVPHLGGMLHYLMARMDDSARTNHDFRAKISKPPSDYLRDFYYDTVNFFLPAMRCAIEAVGPDRIVIGTDLPFFEQWGNLTRSLEILDQLDLSRTDKERITSGNALSLLERAAVATRRIV